jgi:hypothetical protein
MPMPNAHAHGIRLGGSLRGRFKFISLSFRGACVGLWRAGKRVLVLCVYGLWCLHGTARVCLLYHCMVSCSCDGYFFVRIVALYCTARAPGHPVTIKTVLQ